MRPWEVIARAFTRRRAVMSLCCSVMAGLAATRASSGERPATVEFAPSWAAHAVWYQIFPERFENGDFTNDPTAESLDGRRSAPHGWSTTSWTSDWYERAAWEKSLGDDFYRDGCGWRRYGGDLAGVLDRLDHLEALGVNAIYFNPVFYAPSSHKYDSASLHHVDPYFGPDPAADLAAIAEETLDPKTWTWTTADRLFLALLAEAHQRGMHVIVDGVFNHTGRNFPAFVDLLQRQARSPFAGWYVVESFDDPS
ncbi:MAG: hypothetical protein KDA61_02550, partial [Planctomycetales bacterium]|nr:hypothetical protein [Planctomycetales bacterium]